jgi:PadR family transcriptional regulator PadR
MGKIALAFGQVSILHAIADGNRFGFDIMDATGLTSGTVYPTLDKLESLGYLTSRWEDHKAARRDKRPPRRYFDLTAAGATALNDALKRYKNLKPVSLVNGGGSGAPTSSTSGGGWLSASAALAIARSLFAASRVRSATRSGCACT